MTVLTQGRNFLLCIGGIYVVLILCLLQPSLQRELFYLNSLKFPWLVDTGHPEKSGFSLDRAESIFLHGDLHGWHVRPFMHGMSETKSIIDDDAKVVIYLHGTAGTLAIPHRLTTYRILSALPNVHVLAIDYRGYGLSSGLPDEEGLTDDGVSAVLWAIDQGFAPHQITLLGQSLGSAVALAVAHRLALEKPRGQTIEVGHVISVAGFYSATEIVKTYRLAGIVPVLSPFRTYPFLLKWLVSKLNHKWDSITRVKALSQQTSIKLTFAHATTDTEIPSINSEQLFLGSLSSFTNCTHLGTCFNSPDTITDERVKLSTKALSDGGNLYEMSGARSISYLELYWGAHNLVQWNDELLKRV